MIKYSFIVPIYNDGYLIDDFCQEFNAFFQSYINTSEIDEQVELIFVNDGSKDNSLSLLEDACSKFSFIRAITLSKNFGQHIALSCGYQHSKGEYVGMLNVDMEDHPSQIAALLDYIQNNDFDIVTGLYKKRHVSFPNRVTSYCFNLLLNKLTGHKVPYNVSTLRIMNRRFVDAYNSLSEKSRYLPGLELWLGFNHGYIEISHQKRTKGQSSYSFKKRLFMAFESIISFSDLPLKITVLLGMSLALLGFLLIIILIIQKIYFIDFKPGYTTSISVMVLIGGIQLLFLGLASLYIGRILKEVQNRPLYIVKNKINF
ncbi:glycosyltransferase family 2 protein [Sphingobacteriaceae bacterium AH-315-L07]|nr:glycosyltransferase family 2 protein [Bacteroidia bacterium]MBN4052288.1 glycosyltransferase family 2 protein [Sphingobacteriaceae bacterium AH-315-L07]